MEHTVINTALTFKASQKARKRPLINISPAKFREMVLYFGNELVKKEYPTTDFVIDEDNKQILNEVYYYLTGNPKFAGNPHKGIMFVGAYGCGKTTLVKILAEVYGNLARKCFTFLSTLELVDIIAKEKAPLEHYAKRPLILDEVGREQESVSIYGTVRHPVNELLTIRYNSQALTLGTSNFSYRTMAEQYGDYIGERLIQMFNFIEVSGGSRRI